MFGRRGCTLPSPTNRYRRLMPKCIPLPPFAELKEKIAYDPEVGFLPEQKTYRNTRDRHHNISFAGRTWPGQRIAWLLGTGEDPGNFYVDHIDGDPENNKISNLRLVTPSQNRMNRRKRPRGWNLVNGRYRASIYVKGTREELGAFDTPEEAHAAYIKRAKEVHGCYFS